MTLFKIVTTKDPPNPPISLLSITKLGPPPEPSPVISARSKMENYLCTRCGKLKNIIEFGSKNNGTRYFTCNPCRERQARPSDAIEPDNSHLWQVDSQMDLEAILTSLVNPLSAGNEPGQEELITSMW